jgi:sigma-B regulation protein RsbU (phosphoserine phosphatase)
MDGIKWNMKNRTIGKSPADAPEIADLFDSGKPVWGMLEDMEYLVRVLDDDYSVVYMSRGMKDQFGDLTGKPCYQMFYRREKCDNCVSARSRDNGRPEVKDVQAGDRCYRLMASPVILESGETYSVEMFYDITEQKNLEMKLNSDLQFARNIQRGMLPADGLYWGSFRLSALYLPADVLGGDFFDVLRIDKNRSLFYIADVSGHGVHASMLTMFLRGVIHGKLQDTPKSLAALLDSLMKAFIDLDLDPEIYLSLLLCCYDRAKQELSVVNAGHNCHPLVARAGGVAEEIDVGGLPISKLGLRFGHYEVRTALQPGDRLVLYTDGIIEEFSREEQKAFGAEGVKEILKRDTGLGGRELAGKIVGAATEFSNTNSKDDRAIMIADVI